MNVKANVNENDQGVVKAISDLTFRVITIKLKSMQRIL